MKATLVDGSTIRFQRLLPGPVERVWSYLTDSEKRKPVGRQDASRALQGRRAQPFRRPHHASRAAAGACLHLEVGRPGVRGLGDAHRHPRRCAERSGAAALLDDPRQAGKGVRGDALGSGRQRLDAAPRDRAREERAQQHDANGELEVVLG